MEQLKPGVTVKELAELTAKFAEESAGKAVEEKSRFFGSASK